MPIYEFACPKCRKIFSFLSKRLNPDRLPVCPKCGHKNLRKELSRFAMTEMERDMAQLDENNPRHMAHMMRKMKDILPAGSMPKELDVAIKRLEAGEDPEKIEEDMSDVLGDFMGEPEGEGAGGSRG